MSQLVQVVFDNDDSNRTYCYRWKGSVPLTPGDRVLVPPSWASKDPKHATVAAVGSDYDGPVKDIVGVVVDRYTGELYKPGESPEQTVTAPKPSGW